MTPFTIELDDDTFDRLRRRAESRGVTPAEMARLLPSEAADEPDPYAFFGTVSSDRLRGDHVDELLDEEGFGSA